MHSSMTPVLMCIKPRHVICDGDFEFVENKVMGCDSMTFGR